MPRKYASSYIDGLISDTEYGSLVDLSLAICSSSSYSSTKPAYGLEAAAFVYVETLLWFAQAIRSGVWTYYEATMVERQSVMHIALVQFAPEDFVTHYARGMRDWEDETAINAVDEWINKNEDRSQQWLRSHARSTRSTILAATS